MNQRTRSFAFMALLIALMLVFGFTPIGYIPLPFARLTLMCLPVIIGTLVLGLKVGMGLSAVFIITSIAQLLMSPDIVSALLFADQPVMYILCLIVPRLLIPLVTHYTAKALQKKLPRGGLVIASAAGSLVNTFVYLGMLQAFFVPALSSGLTLDIAGTTAMIWTVVLTNGLPEAGIAAVACPLITVALRKSVPPIITKKELHSA